MKAIDFVDSAQFEIAPPKVLLRELDQKLVKNDNNSYVYKAKVRKGLRLKPHSSKVLEQKYNYFSGLKSNQVAKAVISFKRAERVAWASNLDLSNMRLG